MTILLREQEQLIALKLETTYGTSSVPAAVNAVMVQDITIQALEGDVVQRNNFKGFMGNPGSSRLNSYVGIEFAIELASVGAANLGDAPYFSPVLLASGHGEVLTADTDAAYTPVSEDLDSLSIYYQLGEHRHAILGVRGSLSLEGGTKQLPRLRFKGLGLYVAPTKAALSGVTFSGHRKPLRWTKDTVSVLTLDGVTLNGASWSFDQGHTPEFLALTGQEEVICPARNSTVMVKFREDDVSVTNWFEKSRNNEQGAFAMQHGVDTTNDGDIIEFNAPVVEIGTPQRSFEQGIAYLSITCPIVPATKNSDYSFIFR